MENYNVKVIITNVNGDLIKEGSFTTHNMIEIKALGGNHIIEEFIKETIDEIQEVRRDSPHHHKNRLD